MRINLLPICLAGAYILNSGKCFAQDTVYKPVVINPIPKTSFAFTKHWAYAWYITKDDKGRISKAIDGEITKADKAHLYFTADCKTNVQGGYNIRYCYANKKPDGTILLTFRDGEPAYSNSFKANIGNRQFNFEPEIVSPMLVAGQKTTYRVTQQKLVLHQKEYATAKVISGYIDVEFSEVITEGGKTAKHPLYLRGYFKTPVN
ncbi:hypothetical protein BC343_29230 [Mucilaginibacter pedocola]|uniref:DUF4488 domain-containing protein n=2 Tax=Mucilaginibacter pedocola TaxID=1792845 RepID=A0A1S9PDX5_9SPHI|nr:hypothetical protein BC343_29230 [Mucilaginibacter pedocola]